MNAEVLFYMAETLYTRARLEDYLSIAEMEKLARAIRSVAEQVDAMESQPIPPEKIVDLRRGLTVIEGGVR
ncbi:MAG TPA: hypothetical protein VNH17_21345 [Streptosporangiaceae bacterium]|nr:hypothetical protein [Streptosporangiaceae bacterium]